jgi:thiol-disulfide isomerase/thioredoxin
VWLVRRAGTRPGAKDQDHRAAGLYFRSDHPLIVNFWATFCVPCNKEIPYFQSTVARYKDQGVELILVSLDLPDYYPTKIGASPGSRVTRLRSFG